MIIGITACKYKNNKQTYIPINDTIYYGDKKVLNQEENKLIEYTFSSNKQYNIKDKRIYEPISNTIEENVLHRFSFLYKEYLFFFSYKDNMSCVLWSLDKEEKISDIFMEIPLNLYNISQMILVEDTIIFGYSDKQTIYNEKTGWVQEQNTKGKLYKLNLTDKVLEELIFFGEYYDGHVMHLSFDDPWLFVRYNWQGKGHQSFTDTGNIESFVEEHGLEEYFKRLEYGAAYYYYNIQEGIVLRVLEDLFWDNRSVYADKDTIFYTTYNGDIITLHKYNILDKKHTEIFQQYKMNTTYVDGKIIMVYITSEDEGKVRYEYKAYDIERNKIQSIKPVVEGYATWITGENADYIFGKLIMEPEEEFKDVIILKEDFWKGRGWKIHPLEK